MMRGGIRSGPTRTRRFAFVALVALGLVAASALAGGEEVGCGLGTNLKKGKTGLVNHVIASCINGYTGQSISLTFGRATRFLVGDRESSFELGLGQRITLTRNTALPTEASLHRYAHESWIDARLSVQWSF